MPIYSDLLYLLKNKTITTKVKNTSQLQPACTSANGLMGYKLIELLKPKFYSPAAIKNDRLFTKKTPSDAGRRSPTKYLLKILFKLNGHKNFPALFT